MIHINIQNLLKSFNYKHHTNKKKSNGELHGSPIVFFAPLVRWRQKKHFILECEAFKDNGDKYANVLADKSWDDLFNEGTVEKLGALIIKLNRQKIELQKTTCELVYPIDYS